MSIQLMIVVLYVAMLFAISFYVKRRAETSATEYQFAGRKFGALLIAVSVTGMAVGAASTVGVAESATRIGLSAGWYNGWPSFYPASLRCSMWRAVPSFPP